MTAFVTERAAGTPLPTSPTRGEVPPCGGYAIGPYTRSSTLPLVGRAGEGVAANTDRLTAPSSACWRSPSPARCAGEAAAAPGVRR